MAIQYLKSLHTGIYLTGVLQTGDFKQRRKIISMVRVMFEHISIYVPIHT